MAQGLLGPPLELRGGCGAERSMCWCVCPRGTHSCVLRAVAGEMKRARSGLSLCVVVPGGRAGLQEASCPTGHPGPGLQAACPAACGVPSSVARTSS